MMELDVHRLCWHRLEHGFMDALFLASFLQAPDLGDDATFNTRHNTTMER